MQTALRSEGGGAWGEWVPELPLPTPVADELREPKPWRCTGPYRCRKWICATCGPVRDREERDYFRRNLEAYGGRVVLVALDPPGADVLRWDQVHCAHRGPHRHSGPSGCRVAPSIARHWNATAGKRYRRLMDAACKGADRFLRSQGYRGELPRVICDAWGVQKRGLWHVHLGLPYESPAERMWSRQVVRYLDRCRAREAALPGARIRRAVVAEYFDPERHERGIYGFGFVDRAPLKRAGAHGREGAARYLARNASGYLAENAAGAAGLPGRRRRSYVSRRLTSCSHATKRNLRRARWLYVVCREGLELPAWPETELEAVWGLLEGEPARSRAP